MAFQKFPLYIYSVNFVAFIVCLFAFNVCISTADLVQRMAPTITNQEEINKALSTNIDKKKKLVLLLDFDGTLSPIVPVPADAKILPENREALLELAKNKKVNLGIISGRLMKEVHERVNISKIIYAGNHGLEIDYPNRPPFTYQMNPETQRKYNNLVEYLNKTLAKDGAWVEDKKYSLTFHYRNTTEDKHNYFKSEAKKAIIKHGFKADEALMAIEGKPPIDWNKDKTVLQVLKQEFGSNWRNNVNIIYAGDDKADELVMKILKGVGITFRVSSDPNVKTYGDYRVPTPQTVAMILNGLIKIMK